MARDARQAAVASFLAVCVLAQIGFNYRDVMNGAERSALVRLQSIATTTAATIDGEHLASVLFRHRIPESIGHGRSDRQYEEIQSRLAMIERGNTLGTDIYTVHRTELPPGATPDPTEPPYWIGITSATNPMFRKPIEIDPAMAAEFEHGGVVRPTTASDAMLAAFAPIRDKDHVVGVLVVNEDANAVWDAARWTFVANGFVYALILGVLGWVGLSGYKPILRALPEENEYLHSHDPTTGLPNRSTLLVHLGQTIESDKRSGQPTGVALVCLGLDHFRHLNAEAGPRAGDDVLRTLARRLQGEAGSQSLVGRIAGDIFAVVQTGIATTDDAATYARRLLKVFEEPMRLEEQTLTVRATVGVSHFPIHAGEPGALLEAAEEALALAKQRARGQVGLFDDEASVNVKQRKTLAKHIATAIDRDEFFLVYQPIVNRDTKLAGSEALLRWRSPELGLVGPAQFIPIAESTGLIIPLTYWVVARVCEQLRAWQYADANGSYLKVSINLSLLMFRDPAMVDRLCEIVTKSGVPPKVIELEITETGLMGNPEVTLAQLQALKAFGFHMALDDFGTGYSSLGRLAQMPIDALKVDQSFVRGMDKEFSNAVMVRTIIDLGHSLDMVVVAEGVEEERHLAYLRERGCDLLQGYLFDRPLDAEAFYAKWLKTDAPSNVLRLLGR